MKTALRKAAAQLLESTAAVAFHAGQMVSAAAEAVCEPLWTVAEAGRPPRARRVKPRVVKFVEEIETSEQWLERNQLAAADNVVKD